VVYFEQVLQALIREGKVRKKTHPKKKTYLRGEGQFQTEVRQKSKRERRSVGVGKGKGGEREGARKRLSEHGLVRKPSLNAQCALAVIKRHLSPHRPKYTPHTCPLQKQYATHTLRAARDGEGILFNMMHLYV
jgi:hypothetical protein